MTLASIPHIYLLTSYWLSFPNLLFILYTNSLREVGVHMTFSQRMGYEPISKIIQTTDMSKELRNGLWNALYVGCFNFGNFPTPAATARMDRIAFSFYSRFLREPGDERPSFATSQLEDIHDRFFEIAWYKVYDFIEWMLNGPFSTVELAESINIVLSRELSGFRFIEGNVAPIINQEEIASIQSAVDQGVFSGASNHLRQALTHLSNKENPDFRNSIKESISAVESVMRELTGLEKSTLSDSFRKFEKSYKIHPALKEGLLKLYGYASDEDGVRHAMVDDPNLEKEDATFFLVTCSAFVNYFVNKYAVKK